MKKIIIGMSNAHNIAKNIAKKTRAPYSELFVDHFPDGELYIRFMTDIKNKLVVLVQSLHPDPTSSMLELVFAAHAAKNLGAKQVFAFVPYLAYMRQDKMFNPGEGISSHVMGKLLSCVDFFVTIDPHLHRIMSLNEIFKTRTKVLHAASLLSDFIKRKFSNNVLLGPDGESYQWVGSIAKRINFPFDVLLKTRFSSRHVKVTPPKYPVNGRNVVIVDDIVSSGHTIIEAAKALKRAGAKSISVVCVHGVFAENALSKMKKVGLKHIICTNTIRKRQSLIDVSNLFVDLLKR